MATGNGFSWNSDGNVSSARARLVAATIALLRDKRAVSPSWQQLLGLHMNWEETRGSLPECRTGKKKGQKERKLNGRLEKTQQETTKPNGWLSASAATCYSLKQHIKGLDQRHMEPDPRQVAAHSAQACTSPLHSRTGPGCVTGEHMAPFRKGHPAALADVPGPSACCVTLPF